MSAGERKRLTIGVELVVSMLLKGGIVRGPTVVWRREVLTQIAQCISLFVEQSNPTILFLDEPTSGLDSRAALTVMRVVKRVRVRSFWCANHVGWRGH